MLSVCWITRNVSQFQLFNTIFADVLGRILQSGSPFTTSIVNSKPFFFTEATVTGDTYLEMFRNWFMPQLTEESEDFIFQQDGAPPRFHRAVCAHLNEHLPNRWIGRAGQADSHLMKWPPDLTSCGFFLWGHIKNLVYVPPVPRDIDELKRRISEAAASVTADMLERVCQEMEYRIDVCRVAKGAHIESL
jgi:hypothetical protein